ncbi:5-carboxymethyl-2-hydroxymuconate Delta-isomerase [Salibacterium salarium]|uniref:5-carboxymethyl-2-hydroxymuconate Delta-isomerase n=1 Tax=Salibacterium salarium TaxID=284579 RepID=A0A3R9QTK0_9BACI|nr:5-carboxymethyl-2-hydroxymuconate Delta-isomerase [Salibacterium salarium]RSL33128.1 5-carboxymethyl-2-hydroxymuconate Delta-isomerase [Salibacterium salarium]
MPHFIVEYTDNLKAEGDIPELLKKVNNVLIAHPDIFPIGGIRSRAIELNDYLVADGTEDDAFVHAQLKIGRGRTKEEKAMAGEKIFEAIEQHFEYLFDKRYLALSFEIQEFGEDGTYKKNNIHPRYKKRG